MCLSLQANKLETVIPCFYAAWNVSETLPFVEQAQISGGGYLGYGSSMVPAISIDALVDTMLIPKVDFMKFDIEGAEYQGLQGAATTIQRFRPRLAISVYHKSEDLWRLPALVDEICPGYRFYLGHHNYYRTETDLYAIHPSEPHQKSKWENVSADLRRQRLQFAELQQCYKCLKSSRSWKLTAPLRALGRFAKQVRQVCHPSRISITPKKS